MNQDLIIIIEQLIKTNFTFKDMVIEIQTIYKAALSRVSIRHPLKTWQ